jgi:hypothetical protein
MCHVFWYKFCSVSEEPASSVLSVKINVVILAGKFTVFSILKQVVHIGQPVKGSGA